MSPLRIGIIGTGAIGGYYGALLARAGHELHCLVRSGYDSLSRHGLLLDSPKGQIHISKVYAYQRSEDMPICDIILVALKTTSNDLLPTVLPPLCGPHSTVVLLQNGMGDGRASQQSMIVSPLWVVCVLSVRTKIIITILISPIISSMKPTVLCALDAGSQGGNPLHKLF